MLIRQLLIAPMDQFCYLVACEQTRRGVVIDPGGQASRILAQIADDALEIAYIVNTHGHYDHTQGNAAVQQATGAKIAIHHADMAMLSHAADIGVSEGQLLEVGTLQLHVLHTPGHTPGGICLRAEGQLFTGDSVFVGDTGRTDLPGGDRPTLGASVRRLMTTLPPDTVIWPGHDYGPTKHSTIAWERQYNAQAREYGFYQE